MMTPNPYRGFRFPVEVIQRAVWLYHCFSLKPYPSSGGGSVSRRAYKAEWDDGLVGCSSGLHNAERGPSGFGEAEATSGGGNGLVVTMTTTK
jgi:hypothetical protein